MDSREQHRHYTRERRHARSKSGQNSLIQSFHLSKGCRTGENRCRRYNEFMCWRLDFFFHPFIPYNLKFTPHIMSSLENAQFNQWKKIFIKIKSRLDKKKSGRLSVVNVPLRLDDLLPVLRPPVLPRGQGSEAPRPALQEALQLQLGPQWWRESRHQAVLPTQRGEQSHQS